MAEMKEITAGIWHWTAVHPNLGIEVSCYWEPAAGVVIDPLLPDQGLDPFREQPPDRVLLTNRHHLRHGDRFAEEFGSRILCPEPGLHEFEQGPRVEGFPFGSEVAPGIDALEVGVICPDESALHHRGPGALSVADGVIHYGGELGFVPDRYIGDDPKAIKRGLRESYARLLDLDFDTLLFAHGDPIVGGAKQALRDFCTA